MDITDIVENLENNNLSKNVIIKNMKLMKCCLRSNKHICFNDIKKNFGRLLKNEKIVNNISPTIRIYLASCVAEAFSLFAPKIPLTKKSELNIVFELFCSIFSKSSENNLENVMIQEIIEILLSTDAYFLIYNDLIAVEMIESLLNNKENNAIEFIISYINSSDYINQEIVKLFSINLHLKKNINDLQYYNVLKIIPKLNKCHQITIINSLHQYLSLQDFIKTFITISKIVDLSFNSIFSLLQAELINEDDDHREMTFSFIYNLILNIPLNPDDLLGLNFILSRCIDKNFKIRIIVMKIALFFLYSHKENLREKSIKVLEQLSTDPNEKVRENLLDEISKIELINNFHIEYFLNDKSQTIQKQAINIIITYIFGGKLKYFNDLLTYLYEKQNPKQFSIFQKLFQQFNANQLYEITENKKKLVYILKNINDVHNQIDMLLNEGDLKEDFLLFRFISFSVYQTYKTRNLKVIFERQSSSSDNENYDNSSINKFVQNLKKLYLTIPIDAKKILQSHDKAIYHDFSLINPKFYIPMIHDCHTISEFLNNYPEIISIIHLSVNYFNDSTKLIKKLLKLGTEHSLLAVSKIIYNLHNEKNDINLSISWDNFSFKLSFCNFGLVLNYSDFREIFWLKVLYYLGDKKIIPKFIFPFQSPSYSTNYNITYYSKKIGKWILLLSGLFDAQIIIKTHLEISQYDSILSIKSLFEKHSKIIFNPNFFKIKELSFMIRSTLLNINNSSITKMNCLQIIDKELKNPNSSIIFLAFQVIGLNDKDKVISQFSRKSILYHIFLRDKFSYKLKETQQIEGFLNSLFYVIASIVDTDYESSKSMFYKHLSYQEIIDSLFTISILNHRIKNAANKILKESVKSNARNRLLIKEICKYSIFK